MIRLLACVSVTYGNQNCSFGEEDYCGYHDASSGPVKWVRSKNFKDGPPGKYNTVQANNKTKTES